MNSNTTETKRVIDLHGPLGNAYYLLGYAANHSKELGHDPDKVVEEMKESSYDNLIQVFKKYFGDYVDLQD